MKNKNLTIVAIVILLICFLLVPICGVVFGDTTTNDQTDVTDIPNQPETENNDPQTLSFNNVPDQYMDVALIKIGMTHSEVEALLPEKTYTWGKSSSINLFVNDSNTGHVYYVYFKDGCVSDIKDSGIDVTYSVPISEIDKIKDGMTMDEVINVLGRPIGSALFGRIGMAWRVNDEGKESYCILAFRKQYSDSNSYNYILVVDIMEGEGVSDVNQ